jgi:hypothetical protein
MQVVSQLVSAFGVVLSLYGAVQLATRGPIGSDRLAPFLRTVWQIVVLRQVPPDSGGGGSFLNPDRKNKIGWSRLVAGFLFQLLGALLPVVSKLIILALNGAGS